RAPNCSRRRRRPMRSHNSATATASGIRPQRLRSATGTPGSPCCAAIATARSCSTTRRDANRGSSARGSTTGATGACAWPTTRGPTTATAGASTATRARRLLRRPAPVHRPGHAAHLRGCRRTQEHRQLAELLGRDELLRRLLLREQRDLRLLARLAGLRGTRVDLLLHEWGQDPARADCVAGDAGARIL